MATEQVKPSAFVSADGTIRLGKKFCETLKLRLGMLIEFRIEGSSPYLIRVIRRTDNDNANPILEQPINGGFYIHNREVATAILNIYPVIGELRLLLDDTPTFEGDAVSYTLTPHRLP